MRRVGLPPAFLGVEPELFYPVEEEVPMCWYGRGRWKGGALHTFVDDWRQEFFWRRPEEGLLVATLARHVTAPDFTVWTNDPAEQRRYQGWRSAVVGSYWQRSGVRVLPVVSFGSDVERYVRPGSTWAIRGPSRSVAGEWLERLVRFVDRAQVGRLILFGRVPDSIAGLRCPVVWRRLHSATAEG